MELVSGDKVVLKFQHQNLSKRHDPYPEKFKKYEDGDTYEGEILLCEPPNFLNFTWDGNSEVIFELKENG